jgi:hypothetical protein
VRLLAAASAAAALVCAGCGGGAQPPQPLTPKLPRALARSWSREAQAIAAALAEGDGCGAKTRAAQLRKTVIAAVNAGRVPQDFLEPLTSAVNGLPERISCTPPAPAQPAPTQPAAKPPKHGKPEHGPGHGHDHGHGHGQGKKKGNGP